MKKIAAVAAVTVVLANPVAASAHVSAEPSEAAAGTFSTISFGIPHGCDGSATTALTFAIPEGVEKVKPNVNPTWDITLDQQNDRVTSVTYKAKTPLPDTLRDSVALTVKPAESAAGQALLFPVTQTCERGEIVWDAADHSEKHPAPAVQITAKQGDEHSHGGHSHEGHESHEAQDAAAPATESSPLAGWGVGLGAVGVLLGLAALIVALRRR